MARLLKAVPNKRLTIIEQFMRKLLPPADLSRLLQDIPDEKLPVLEHFIRTILPDPSADDMAEVAKRHKQTQILDQLDPQKVRKQ